MEILGYIKVYFTEQEKEQLQQIANEQNLALSQLIRHQCDSILNPSYAIMSSLLDAKDLAEHNGNKYIKVFLSENEHKKLQIAAQEKGVRMSRLIYERLHATSAPIEITYKAGYTTIPNDIKQAMLYHIASMWLNRGDYDNHNLKCPQMARDIYKKYKIIEIGS